MTRFMTTISGCAMSLAMVSPAIAGDPPPVVVELTTGVGLGADATVRGGTFADVAMLEIESLNMRNGGVLDETRKAYMRFDTSGVLGDVIDAQLVLSFAETHPTFVPAGVEPLVRLFTIPDAGAWSEDTMTWNNAPENDTGSNRSFRVDATLVGNDRIGAGPVDGDVHVFDDPRIAEFIAESTDGLCTFALSSFSSPVLTSSFVFASKERGSTVAPRLVLTVINGPCSGVDFARPFGSLGIEDVQAFLQHFAAGDPRADLGLPTGTFDIADIVAFMGQLGDGCP